MVKIFQYSRTNKNDPQKESKKKIDKQSHSGTTKPKEIVKERYQSSQKKMKKMKVSIITKFESIQLLPYSFQKDQMGSFFFDELENAHKTEPSDVWRSFYKSVLSKSKSLPLILLNYNEIFTHIFELMKENSIIITSLKLLFALIRDVKDMSYETMISKGVSEITQKMMVDEQTFEKSIVVLGGLVRNSLEKITKNLELFLDTVFQICFDNFREKQIIRVFAELISFVFKKTPDSNLKSNFVLILFRNVKNYAKPNERVLTNNLVYFFSCFGFEILKSFQSYLDSNVEDSLKLMINQIKELSSVSVLENKQEVFDIIQKGFRLIQFKFMKAELRFAQSNNQNEKTFLSVLQAFESEISSSIIQDILIDLTIDRMMFRNYSVFKQEYLNFAIQFIEKTDPRNQKYEVLLCLILPSLSSKSGIEKFMRFFKNSNVVHSFLHEVVFLEKIEEQNESFNDKKYIFMFEKPKIHLFLNQNLFESIVSLFCQKESLNLHQDQLCNSIILLEKIGEKIGVSDFKFSFDDSLIHRLLQSQTQKENEVFVFSLSLILKRIETEVSVSIFDKHFHFFETLIETFFEKFRSLKLTNFDYSKIAFSTFQRLNDLSHDSKFTASFQSFSIICEMILSFSKPQINKLKNEKRIADLQSKIEDSAYFHPIYFNELSNSKMINQLIHSKSIFDFVDLLSMKDSFWRQKIIEKYNQICLKNSPMFDSELISILTRVV
jgi:hypothetical protein